MLLCERSQQLIIESVTDIIRSTPDDRSAGTVPRRLAFPSLASTGAGDLDS